MLETMTKIASYTVPSGGQANVTFLNIPQYYTDLKLVISARTARTSDYVDDLDVVFNNDTGANYTTVTVQNNQGSTQSLRNTGVTAAIRNTINSNTATSNNMSNTEMYITNYTSNTTKIVQIDTTAGDATGHVYAGFVASFWYGTAPITQIKITGDQASIMQNSTFYLYGIKNEDKTVGNSIKATGGLISTDGTYVYHRFNSTGSFIPTMPLIVDYLVVAGGGGGGNAVAGQGYSGGGGAGGLRCTVGATGGGGTVESKLSLLKGNPYAVTVGAGGSGGAPGTNGTDSSFYSIASTGGGYGGYIISYSPYVGNSGGSGGGGGANNGGGQGTLKAGGTGVTNQGYAGADGGSEARYSGGGGGGAGGAGTTSSKGGIGVATVIASGVSTYFAGGGGGSGGSGGGTAGLGGGGNSADATGGYAAAGTANTGGGGGAGTATNPYSGGASGGSGVVIIRYKA